MPDSLPPGGPEPRDPVPDGGAAPTGLLIHEILSAIWAHRWLTMAVTVLALGAAVGLIALEDPEYRATATIQQADPRRALTSGIEDPDAEPERIVSPLFSLIQLLGSRSVIGSVVDAQGLQVVRSYTHVPAELVRDLWVDPRSPDDTVRILFGAHDLVAQRGTMRVRAGYGQRVDLGTVRFSITGPPGADQTVWPILSREEAIDAALASIGITQRPQTNIVDVSYTAPSALVAQRVVNALVDSFQVADVRRAQEQSHRRRIFLERQIRETDSLLTAAQLAVSRYRSSHQTLSSKDLIEARQNDLLTIQLKQAELQADRRMYQSLLALLRSPTSGQRQSGIAALVATPELAANPVVGQLYKQLADYRTSLDSLTTGAWRSSATNPDVERLTQLIGSTEMRLEDAVKSQVTALDARISAVGELGARSAAAIEALPEIEARDAALEQQVETLQSLVDQLREDYQKARMAEAVEAGQVEIVDRAALPYQPVSRLRSVKMALGLLLGLVLGGALSLVLERMNTSLRRREEVEEVLRVPSLALIPKLIDTPGGVRRRLLPRRGGRARAEALPLLGAGAVTTPQAASAPGLTLGEEAYRLLRTNILLAQSDPPLRTLAVSSALPGDGKTVTAANLAVAFAREGLRVLLVDADLRRGRLHALLGVSRAPGLAEVLRDEAGADDAVRPTSTPGLSLLPRGSSMRSHGAERLRGARMSALLDELALRFDLVVLDSPPVLSVADASIIAAAADGVLFVVRAGETGRAEAQQALQQLAAVGARVVGSVLNDPRGRLSEYFRYYTTYAESAASD